MSVDVAAQVPPGIGPYQPLRLLGEGGMGKVYLARSPGARLVALKVIRPEYTADAAFRDRFRREADAARRVSGFFTTPVVDADADGPQPWLATSYVPAPALSEVVRRFGPLAPPALRALGAGLAEALAAIHGAGLIHRDLKPGNVLVAGDGPRVIDFGISRAVDGTQVTRTGGMVGTPGFMAPEQISSAGEPSAASDVFALGCVLVFAATGANPFGAGDAANLLYRVVYDAPDLDGVPADLRTMVGECLDKDPAARPGVPAVLAALSPADPAALITPPLRDDLAARGREAASIATAPVTAPPPVPAPGVGGGISRRAVLAIGGGGAATVATAGTAALLAGVFGGDDPPVKRENVPAGAVSAATDVPAGPAPAWTMKATVPNGRLALVDGTLIWWSHGGGVAMGVDAASGTRRWVGDPQVPADDADRIEWAGVFGSTLFGTARMKHVFGLDATGKQLFRYPTPEGSDGRNAYVHSVHDAGGGVLLLHAGAVIIAMDVSSGRRLWESKTQFVNANDTVTDGGRVYVQDTVDTRALDLRSGEELWSTRGTAQKGASPHLSVSQGMLVLATTSLTGLDAATGKPRWSAIKGSLILSKTTADAGDVFVEDPTDRLWALDIRSGKPRWNTTAPLKLNTSSVGTTDPASIAASGTLVAAPLYEPHGGFMVFRRSDGKALWAHKPPNGSVTKPWAVLISGDTVYAASETALYAFKNGS